MKILIGIDDTDNLESRGTGFRSRELGTFLQQNNLAKLIGITRHQLLFDQRIPYTSHNSSACLEIEGDDLNGITNFCADYLYSHSAEGSDAGLCVAPKDMVVECIQMWGARAKKEILTQEEARKIAQQADIFLEGYTGDKGGIIGSLAAIGLRKAGSDGRFLWVKGMRELSGVFTTNELLQLTGIDIIESTQHIAVLTNEKIYMGDWWRPVLKNHKIVIFVEPNNISQDEQCKWQIVSKEYIKSISN